MNKEKNVIEFYVLCNKLKNTIRTGWKDWNVKRERIESVAEHIYGTLMLAIAINSEYEYSIDLKKVLYMLSIHELGEIIIGDLTQFQITREEKRKLEKEAVSKILKNLSSRQEIEKLYIEFEERETKEAIFAHMCDKLECDLQCKLYDEEGCVDINNQENNKSFYDPKVQDFLKNNYSWSSMWLNFGQDMYNYDNNFKSISSFAINNKIENEDFK